MLRVLVTGASGQLGRHVVAAVEREGHLARALSRSPTFTSGGVAPTELFTGDITVASSLRGACDGVDVVVACAGASMRMDRWGERASFTAVDFRGNSNLLAEARRAGVRRVIYVSLYGADAVAGTEYARAHERFVALLGSSDVAHTVVRPTGYFSTFASMLPMARRGMVAVVGDGRARTNPVHEADVARCCVRALYDGPAEIAIGGPDVFTRLELAALSCEAVGRVARPRHVSPALARAAAAPLRLVHPRLHGLLEFGTEVSLVDAVAPRLGVRSLHDHFTAVGATLQHGGTGPRSAFAA